MFFFDPMYFVFALPALLLALWAQMKVKGTFHKYSEVRNAYNITGAETAARLARYAGLGDIRIEPTPGELSDHYDPSDKTLRLSEPVYGVPSVAAMAVAAHELGHAVQDQVGYSAMRLRSALVGPVTIGSNLGPILFIIGFMFSSPTLAWIGIIAFSAAVAFALVTLPVEFDASNRALKLLQATGLVTPQEYDGAKAVLSAAAWTYVAGALQAISVLLYYVFSVMGLSRREE